MKESKYFNINEFKCKHCNNIPLDMPPDLLIDILDSIREYFGAPVIINSGYRCDEHNAAVGGSSKSRHKIGDAVDFIVKGVETKIVYDYVIDKYDDEPFGIAIKINDKNPYRGFVHIDTRNKKARWEYK